MNVIDPQRRVISAMRPLGPVHIGQHHGVLKNWVQLQHEYECFFYVADIGALGSMTMDDRNMPFKAIDGIQNPVRQYTWEMLIDWLAVGIKAASATLFIQSHIPERAELQQLLSIITPTSWLERSPAYRELQNHFKDSNQPMSYGLLGYPLLQATDILAFRAGIVPVGSDQIAHVEIARDIARHFNHMFGGEQDFEINAEQAIKKLGKKNAQLYSTLRQAYTRHGDGEALATAQVLIRDQTQLTLSDKERLLGYLDGEGKIILPEPNIRLADVDYADESGARFLRDDQHDDAQLGDNLTNVRQNNTRKDNETSETTPRRKGVDQVADRHIRSSAQRVIGLDGRKMSNALNNCIPLRALPDDVRAKVKNMPTDPARVRLSDAGDPSCCPVFGLHLIYSSESDLRDIASACQTARRGCVECKYQLADSIIAEQTPIIERAQEYVGNPSLLRNIINEGTERARDEVRNTLDDVKEIMGISYR